MEFPVQDVYEEVTLGLISAESGGDPPVGDREKSSYKTNPTMALVSPKGTGAGDPHARAMLFGVQMTRP